MNWVTTAAAVVVGAVFVVAGASKIAAGGQWPVNARDLGAPRWVVPLIPGIELATGSLMLVQLFEPWPELVAIGLLVAFSALIALRLRSGDRPVCACFGQWSASEIGARHLVRNALLIVLAALAAAG